MDLRFRLFIISLVGMLAAAVWTFPQWYPRLTQDDVGEVFPGLDLELQADYVALPYEQREAFSDLYEEQPDSALGLVQALLRGDQVAPDSERAFEPGEASVVRRGVFFTIDPIRTAEGEVLIYQYPDQSQLMRFESFRSAPAPGLHVVFTRNPDPTDERGVGVDYIDLGPLKGNVGAQNFNVPEGLSFSRYPVVALYSPELNFVIATATLR